MRRLARAKVTAYHELRALHDKVRVAAAAAVVRRRADHAHAEQPHHGRPGGACGQTSSSLSKGHASRGARERCARCARCGRAETRLGVFRGWGVPGSG
eukprot:3988651-Prymnesium_polylepis.1